MNEIREFVTIDDSSSEGQRTDYYDDSADTVYVAEIVRDAKATDVDEDDVECHERDAIRTLTSDLYVPLFCCRGPARKLPPQTPEEALALAARRGREALRPGMAVMLNGTTITI